MSDIKIHDTVVIGGGVTGSSAGMYAARFNLDVVVYAEQPGGLITTTNLVENYPGIKSITGPDMGMVFMEHAMESGAKFEYDRIANVEKIELEGKPIFKLLVGSALKEVYAWTVVLATGTKHKYLGAPGEKEYSAKGVTYCALCDAAFFKEKTVVVVGGGDSAAIDANILAQHVAKVYVMVRGDKMRAEPVNIERIQSNPKVEIMYQTEIAEIQGDDQKVTQVLLKDGKTLPVDGVFVAIGWTPMSDLAKQVGADLDERGEVIVTREAETNVPGFYAAGDVTDAKFKQAIIGAAEGVYASVAAYNYIQNNVR
jgi:thioredoxin reductase (NADPH)